LHQVGNSHYFIRLFVGLLTFLSNILPSLQFKREYCLPEALLSASLTF
jgi:hypothetical protein